MKLTESCLYLPSLNTKMQRKEIETLIYQQMGRKKKALPTFTTHSLSLEEKCTYIFTPIIFTCCNQYISQQP